METNMYKHTEGPWRIEETEDSWFILANERDSAQVAVIDKGNAAVTLPDEITPEQAKANAILICGSSELLEKSEQFVAWFMEFIGEDAWKECLENCPELQRFLIAVTWSKS
jgi:hypothetical protein